MLGLLRFISPLLHHPPQLARSARLISFSLPVYAKKRNMPPKKAAAAEKKTLLGRPGNNLKIGIVGPFLYIFSCTLMFIYFSGVPNVGKSSFFNTLSKTGQ
jgi:obg-like ATPase 1